MAIMGNYYKIRGKNDNLIIFKNLSYVLKRKPIRLGKFLRKYLKIKYKRQIQILIVFL